MPWVRQHRRRVPYGLFRTTTVRSHHRRSPRSGVAVVALAIAVLVILLLIALF